MCFAVQTPELLADVEVPESVSILGQTVDLSQVRSLLQPVSQGLSGIISQVRGQPWAMQYCWTVAGGSPSAAALYAVSLAAFTELLTAC